MYNQSMEEIILSIEKKYPLATEEFIKIQSIQYLTFCKKLNDYGPYNVTMGKEIKNSDDIKTALSVILVRISDKFQRLLNIIFYKKILYENICTDSVLS